MTGGAGLIGSAVVWELNRRALESIVVCDRLGSTEKWRNLAPLRFADYLEADEDRSRRRRAEPWAGSIWSSISGRVRGRRRKTPPS